MGPRGVYWSKWQGRSMSLRRGNALLPLSLSGPLQIAVPTSGSILGTTPNSSIVGNIPGITVNGPARTYSGTPSGASGPIANGLVETLAGAKNSPNNSAVTVAP